MGPGDPRPENRIFDELAKLERVLLANLDLEERDVLPSIHGHLSVQEWAERHGQAIGNGASGLRAPLMLAGMVLETRSAGTSHSAQCSRTAPRITGRYPGGRPGRLRGWFRRLASLRFRSLVVSTSLRS